MSAYPTPSFSTVRRWAAISGLLYSVSCIARAIGIPVTSVFSARDDGVVDPRRDLRGRVRRRGQLPSPTQVDGMTLVDVGPVEPGFLSIGLPGHQEVPSSGLGVLDGKGFARPHQDELTLLRGRVVRAERGGALE